jgi:hypothetical protein
MKGSIIISMNYQREGNAMENKIVYLMITNRKYGDDIPTGKKWSSQKMPI